MKSRTSTVSLLALITLLTPGWSGAQQGAFRWPVSVAVGGTPEILVVSENARHRINVHDSSGALIVRVGSQGVIDGQFSNPVGVAVDSQGFIYVADMGNSRVQKFDRLPASSSPSGARPVPARGNFASRGRSRWTPRTTCRCSIPKPEEFRNSRPTEQPPRLVGRQPRHGRWSVLSGLVGVPADLVIDSAGVAYVTDTANHRVQKWRIISDATAAIQSATFLGWSGGCTSGSECDVSVERSSGVQLHGSDVLVRRPSQGSGGRAIHQSARGGARRRRQPAT